MSATLKLTHKAIGVEVRRGTFDVVVDGGRVGSLEMNDRDTNGSWRSHPASPQRPKLEPHSDLRCGRGPGRRLPMHRKEVLADLPPVVRRATPGALAPSGVAGALRIERSISHSNLESTCANRRYETEGECPSTSGEGRLSTGVRLLTANGDRPTFCLS